MLDGLSIEWQDKHNGICIFLALWGHLSSASSICYCFVILLDVALMISMEKESEWESSNLWSGHPMWHSRHASTLGFRYHAVIWTLTISGCLPPLIGDGIGIRVLHTTFLTFIRSKCTRHMLFQWQLWQGLRVHRRINSSMQCDCLCLCVVCVFAPTSKWK